MLHPLTRTLAALLVLVAAFAYPLRLTPGPGGGDPTFQTERAADHCGRPRHGGPSHHTPPHTGAHEAHCLFCLTGAFALAPGPGVGVGAVLARPAVSRPPTPRAAHGLPLRARARAPPQPLA